MKFKILALVIASTLALSSHSQHAVDAYLIGYYNIENLFDTIDDPNKIDEQFLPDGSYGWGTLKYTNKLDKMSYVISTFPHNLAVLGVGEAENITVLEDLVKHPNIANRGLKPILIEGPDRRGIDVGLLYNPKLFTPTNVTSTHVKSDIENFITRSQLCVTGQMAGEEINIIVVHWPSRGGGEKRSMPRRRDAALTTKSLCDSLYRINPEAKIIIMGDLNDDPVDESVAKHLGAKGKKESVKKGELYNPAYRLFKRGIGSLGYQDQWNLFDQVIISHALLTKDRSTLSYWKAEIYNKNFLKQQSGQYKGYPLRTHAGGTYTNGYSDHFPSLLWLVKTK